MLPIMKRALAIGYGFFSISKNPVFTGRNLPPAAASSVMTPNGHWQVVDTNDALVFRLKPPVVVHITPGGFSIGKGIFGSFQVEPLRAHSRSGVHVSMCMYNINFLKRVYLLEPLAPDRIALFGLKRTPTTYYILKRVTAETRNENIPC